MCLKDHVHESGHRNDLSTVQTELLVVVQHCVHILNPDSIDWPVNNNFTLFATSALEVKLSKSTGKLSGKSF
jgi:uncharacterized protein YaiE (UPF0345 family)